MADDEDEVFGGLYEDGHWIWDETTQALVFVSDLPPVKVETVQVAAKVPTAGVEFRDDIDLIEQVRYRRRYQRKLLPGQADLITLQDVKDLVIYTAPIHILSPMLIDLLHLPSTERFLRALIFCCAYYIQVAEEMAFRMAERKTKIRTTTCDVLENEFKENLSDLRLLVAKEYCVMLIGGGDTKKFHHMGSNKKRRSLSDKDARLFESFMQLSVQIVYLALGRQKLRQIELECHRIFKSEIFNTVEHTYKTGYLSQMTAEERKVLLGTNLKYEKKLNTRSPLMNEVFSFRPINFRLMGLGIVKYEEITERLYYLFLVVAGSEEKLLENNMSVGLIGLPRSSFDTTLHPLPGPSPTSKSMSKKSQASSQGASSHSSTAQRVSTKSKVGKSQAVQKLYPTIYLPDREPIDSFFPSDFPEQPEDVLPVSQIQRHRWQTRLLKLTKPSRAFVNI